MITTASAGAESAQQFCESSAGYAKSLCGTASGGRRLLSIMFGLYRSILNMHGKIGTCCRSLLRSTTQCTTERTTSSPLWVRAGRSDVSPPLLQTKNDSAVHRGWAVLPIERRFPAGGSCAGDRKNSAGVRGYEKAGRRCAGAERGAIFEQKRGKNPVRYAPCRYLSRGI